MAIVTNQEDLAKVLAWMDEGRRLMGLIPPEPGTEGAAPSGDATGEAPPADQFSTPALGSSAPASVPTIEPVPEDQVPDEVKAQDQAGQA